MANLPSHDQIIETDLLRTFFFVVELNSATKAASALALTQSAISHKLKKLEEVVGRPLLKRKGKSFILTTSGEQLFYYAQRILELNQEVLKRVSLSESKTEVKLGMPFVYWRYLLSKIEPDYFEKQSVVVNLFCANSTNLHRLFERHEIDLCLSVRHDELTHGQVIATEPLSWVGMPGTELHKQRPLPLVVFDEECIYRKKMLKALEEREIPWDITLISQDTSAVREAIKSGYGISLLGERTIDQGMEMIQDDQLPQISSVDIELRAREGGALEDLSAQIKSIFSGD